MMLLLLASVILAGPEVTVVVPDTVNTGEVFTCEVTVEGEDLQGIDCQPVYSRDLQHLVTGSMHSMSSVSTPSGTRVTASTTFSMSFAAWSSGDHTIGPMSITSSGRTIYTTDQYTVTAIGGASATGPPQGGGQEAVEPPDEIAWIEVVIDTTGRVYPGQTFEVDYYICKSVPSADVVDLYLEPSDYATSRLSDDIEQLQWSRDKSGTYRTWLATLEVTPAFACTLSLPVLRGRIGLPGGMIRPSREYLISTEGTSIPVYPFPLSGMPDNFSGITGSIEFDVSRISRGYSAGGERCLKVTASGPGAERLRQLPELTVEGPAVLRPGRCSVDDDGSRVWNVLVEPSDSGRVIVGPDSIAWFDTSEHVYRQSYIPSCTLSVYPVSLRSADLSNLIEDSGDRSLFWVIIVSVMLFMSFVLIVRYRSRVSAPADVMEAGDVEELLTAMGDRLSVMLTGSRSYMGFQELDEILESRSIDVILSRRLLRHWKDLELMLSGREITEEHLQRLREKSVEILGEVAGEVDGEEA